MPQAVQNLALGLSTDPQDVHFAVVAATPSAVAVGCRLGVMDGSGDGNVPTFPNASLADTIPGGPPTGF